MEIENMTIHNFDEWYKELLVRKLDNLKHNLEKTISSIKDYQQHINHSQTHARIQFLEHFIEEKTQENNNTQKKLEKKPENIGLLISGIFIIILLLFLFTQRLGIFENIIIGIWGIIVAIIIYYATCVIIKCSIHENYKKSISANNSANINARQEIDMLKQPETTYYFKLTEKNNLEQEINEIEQKLQQFNL